MYIYMYKKKERKVLFYLQILLPVPCVNLIQITMQLVKLMFFEN